MEYSAVNRERLLPAVSGLGTVAAIAVLAIASTAPGTVRAQAAGVDPDAARILKRMTDYVGSLPRFGVETASTVEVVLVSGQKLQFDSATRLTLVRPDKLRAERVGDLISQSFYYDGRALTIFNPDDRYYATVPAPGTLDEMVDFARESLDVVAPASDLVTKDAYERLMADATSGFVVGKSVVGGVRCDHLAFRGADVDWQVWVEEGDKPFPRKYVITTLDVAGAPQFEVRMSNWTLSPEVSAKQFEFVPPPGAKRTEFLPVGNAGAQP